MVFCKFDNVKILEYVLAGQYMHQQQTHHQNQKQNRAQK